MNKDELIEYIYEFAWQFGRAYHIGDFEKIKASISERFQLPEECFSEKIVSIQDEKQTKTEDSSLCGEVYIAASIEEEADFTFVNLHDQNHVLRLNKINL